MAVKRKALEIAAQELNFFLDPNPPINVKAPSSELKEKVLEAGNLLVDGEQELSLSTETGLEGEELEERKAKIVGIQNTLRELGVPLFGNDAPKEGTEQETTEEPQMENTDPKITLIDMVQKTRKLVDLKAIVEAEDEFESLQKKLDEFVGLTGPRLLKAEMLKILGVAPTQKVKKDKKEKGPGVIKTIKETIKTKGPISKAGILQELEKRFPERNPDSMKKTINVQVPTRINKESDFQIVKNEEKEYYVVK